MFSKTKKIFHAFSKKERLTFVGTVFCAVISGIILCVLFIASSTKIVPARGGMFVEGIIGQPTFINPVVAQGEADKALTHLIFSNLKDLSEKIEMDQDGRVWRVRLKEGLFWHDGEKLTSDDVIFTVQKIQNPDSRSPLFSSWQGIFAQRLSELEMQFNLGTPYAFFEANYLENLFILPKHLFADIPPANWRFSDFNLNPVGSGPYLFSSYDKEPNGFITEYNLVANSNYHKGQPFITSIKIKFFTKKEDALGAFNAGKIDSIANLEPQDMKSLKRPYALTQFNLPNYYAVFVNQNQHLALKEKSVRDALLMATNRENIGSDAFRNLGSIAYGPIPSSSDVFNPDIKQDGFSLEKASELLGAAGWQMGVDGFRQKNIHNATITLEFSLTVPQVNFLTETAHQLKESWEKIGVKTNIAVLPTTEVREGPIKNRDYQLLLFGNILNKSYDLFPFWSSSERFYPSLNLSLYNSKPVDQLIETIKREFDAEKRKRDFFELQRVITEDTPALFLYAPNYLYVTVNDLRGVEPILISESADRFTNVREWYLKTARVLK